jgi:eukaryotic-like serine/threonine-protein kinase
LFPFLGDKEGGAAKLHGVTRFRYDGGAVKVCPNCGSELKAGSPAGLCPACLLAAAMGSGFPSVEPEAETLTAQIREPADGDSFGPYRILRVLGEGGMGTVYLAEQTEPIRRRVALKVVKLGMDTNQVLARFHHERQSLALMEHSGIARILDAGASLRGRPFFVMDYIEGLSITGYCDRHQLTVAQRLQLFVPVCRAVQHAHNKGIIHRDLKPSNVLVATEDSAPVAKVIDFGIARVMDRSEGNTLATELGQMVGTPEYASPEQADVVGGEIGAATDVYALGVVLYEMLIGAVPFDGTMLRKAGFAGMLRIIREEEPPSLAQKLSALGPDNEEIATRRGTSTGGLRKLVDGDLNWIVKKALEKSPERRYASPSELSADIERYLQGERVLAGPPSPIRRFRKPVAVAATFVILIAAAWLIKRALPSKPQGARASTILLSDLANDSGDPSFDGAFRQAVGFELARAENLTLLPESRAAEVLAEMRRPPGTRLTPDIAREICQRSASAAFIEGSLSKAGSGYLITLRARNCTAGDLVDEEQSQASSKDGVVKELRRMTARLQSKSAASFVALQKSAVPMEEVTTRSFEALKSFTTAGRQAYVNPADSLLLFKRAIEIDPEFAMAYAHLARSYADAGEQSLAAESIRHAYLLRGVVSDKENYMITYNYNREVLRNLEICRQVCDSWIAKYPRDVLPHGYLSGLTSKGTAQYEKSIEEAEKAVALDPDFTIGYQNMADAYLFLNLPEKTMASHKRATDRKLAVNDNLGVQFFAAFLSRDRRTMATTTAQVAAASPYGNAEHFDSLVSAFEGRLQQARRESTQAVTLARQAHFAERSAAFEGAAAVREALYGYPEESSRHSQAVHQLAVGRDVDFPRGFALALSRNSAAVLPILARLEKEYTEDTCVRFTYAPALRALLAINAGSPAKAIEALTVSKAYERAQNGVSLYYYYGALYPTYVRGMAYQQLHQYSEAAAEFQRMLDNPGLLLADPIGPAARLQLARALRDAGETARAKTAYGDFLSLWKGADQEIPIFQQAKAEFSRL